MKYLVLVAIVFISIACISQNKQSNYSSMSIENQIKNGQPVFINDKVFDDAIDFTNFMRKHLVGVNLQQVEVRSSITFKNCVFKKPVTAFMQTQDATILTSFLSNVSFLECQFEDAVSFRGSSFYGRLDFSLCKFFGNTSFEEINAQQSAYFNDCRFDTILRFQNATFMQKVNFLNTLFNKNVSFQNTVFNGEAQFSNTNFYGYTDFSLIDCRANVFFNYAAFADRATLSSAKFNGNFHFVSTKNKSTRFDNSRFMSEAKFDKSTVKENLSFENSFFLMGEPDLSFVSNEKLIIK